MNRLYPEVADRARKRCEYCRAPEAPFNFPFEVEHITPLTDRGGDELANLALACRSCNAFKAALRDSVDPDSGEIVPLFNPRSDHWSDHFIADPEGTILRGLTPCGRATIAALHLNSPEQVLARSQWKRLGLFP